eukprot:5818346-Pleurochrysis_carterae.AAC.1
MRERLEPCVQMRLWKRLILMRELVDTARNELKTASWPNSQAQRPGASADSLDSLTLPRLPHAPPRSGARGSDRAVSTRARTSSARSSASLVRCERLSESSRAPRTSARAAKRTRNTFKRLWRCGHVKMGKVDDEADDQMHNHTRRRLTISEIGDYCKQGTRE